MSAKRQKAEDVRGDVNYQVYIDERKALVDGEQSSAENFDKNIITLAAGALGISLIFIEKIAPDPNKQTLIYLYLAWGSLLLSLLATLSGLLTSQHSYSRARDILEDEFFPQQAENGNSKKNRWAAWTHFFNWTSIAAFIVGTAMLAFFSIQNMKYGLAKKAATATVSTNANTNGEAFNANIHQTKN